MSALQSNEICPPLLRQVDGVDGCRCDFLQGRLASDGLADLEVGTFPTCYLFGLCWAAGTSVGTSMRARAAFSFKPLVDVLKGKSREPTHAQHGWQIASGVDAVVDSAGGEANKACQLGRGYQQGCHRRKRVAQPR